MSAASVVPPLRRASVAYWQRRGCKRAKFRFMAYGSYKRARERAEMNRMMAAYNKDRYENPPDGGTRVKNFLVWLFCAAVIGGTMVLLFGSIGHPGPP